ncbi:hypothetical protein JOF41_003866 [Saccharothrix coeruleofusca]|uniref:VMAP-C domain-containing protein n=1 Tax=Saccharothrix coeruleofusca TaxID=33919 RepID=UPI001AEB2157|nr:hypothetical protein [Saccharothrix coeruleofusca]MBP2337688.1 hypothetical protein [Saccharothrix coeruleofusca]
MLEAEDSTGRRLLLPLVSALRRVSCLNDLASRNTVVQLLGNELREPLSVPESHHQGIHLSNLALACLQRTDGLSALLRVLTLIEQDAKPLYEVRRVIDELTPLELFQQDQLGRLFTLLAGVVVPEIADIYREVAGPDAPALRGQTTYPEVFRVLGTLNSTPSGIPLPLLFVERVAMAVRAELAIELRRWADQRAAEMDLTEELEALRAELGHGAVPVGTPPPSSPAYLVLKLEPEGPTGEVFRLRHWHQLDLREEWAPLPGHDVTGTLEAIKSRVAEIISRVEHEWAAYDPEIHIEWVLGRDTVNLDVDQWPWDDDPLLDEPMGCRYPVAVRLAERRYHGAWRKRWAELTDQLRTGNSVRAGSSCRGRTGENGLRELMAALNDRPDLVCLVLSAPPRPDTPGWDELAAGVRAGVPVMVWHREDCASAEFTALAEKLLHDADDQHLLERARRARTAAFRAGPGSRHVGGALTVLYDDPDRPVVPAQPRAPVGNAGGNAVGNAVNSTAASTVGGRLAHDLDAHPAEPG